MATITFDTHKFVRRLQEAGFEEKQAEAISEAFKEASGEAELATKRDIERLEASAKRALFSQPIRLWADPAGCPAPGN